MTDDPKLDDMADTGPLNDGLDDAEVEHARTIALPSIPDEEKTNPVQRSMLTAMVSDDDDTEFLRQSEVDSSYEATVQFDAQTLETDERAALQRRRGPLPPPPTPPPPDDNEVITLETDEQQALKRRRADPPMTAPAVLLHPPPDEPPTQPRPAIRLPEQKPSSPDQRGKSAFWKRDSFWNPKQATQPASLLRVPISEDAFLARERDAFKIALAGSFFGAVVALAIAMSTWMAPLKVIVLAITCAIPMAAVTGWFTRPDDLDNFSIDDLKILVRPVALGTAVLLVFTLPWQLGVVRSLLRPFAANTAAMSLEVLQDRSETVATNECVRIAPNPERVRALAEGLPGRVEVTRACFERVTDQPGAAARDVLGQWRPLMVAPTVDKERACDMAKSAAALPLPPWELRSTFVDCVVEAGTEVQDCCGKALAGINDGTITAPPDDYVPAEAAASSWLQFSLGSLSDRQQKIRESSGLDTRMAQGAAIDFACRAADQGMSMGPAFVSALKSCGIGADTPTDTAYWQRVCASMRERHAAQKDRTKARALCDAAKSGGALLGTQPSDGEEP